jgi:peptidoglycan/xylan/chitin deacetylase (PgdA/CDA1 family)
MKKILFTLLHKAGVDRLAAWWNRKRVIVICYHSVTKSSHHIPHEFKLHTPLNLFTSHLDYLQRHYNIISLGEYIRARREGKQLPDYCVVLTFDDGTRNFLTVVAPLLAERSLPATAFVITELTERSFARGDSSFEGWTPIDDLLYLSWSEVSELSRKPGIDIGSHSHTHPDLTTVPVEEARRELRDSLVAIAEHTGKDAPALAYPHGRATEKVREIAASLGYECALTGELGANDMESDLYELRRVVIAGDDDLPTFAARVSGLTWWHVRARNAISGKLAGSRMNGDRRAAQDSAGKLKSMQAWYK